MTDPTPLAGCLVSTNGSWIKGPLSIAGGVPCISKPYSRFSASLILAFGAPKPAHAQFAVIDVASIAQLIQEVQQLEQQVATAKSQLTQAQSEYAAITGNRGMQNLLSGTNRNYLPTDWTQLAQVMTGSSASLSRARRQRLESRQLQCGADARAGGDALTRRAGPAHRRAAESRHCSRRPLVRRSRTRAAASPRFSS